MLQHKNLDVDKYEKRILEYFLNKGRGSSVEAHILKKEARIPLKKFGDIMGSCVSRKYLWHSPSANGSKYDQYGLEEIGLRAIDEELKNSKNNRFKIIGLGVSIAGIVVAIIALFR